MVIGPVVGNVDGPAPEVELQGSNPTSPTEMSVLAPKRVGAPRPGVLVVVLALVMVACVALAFFGVFAYGLSAIQEQRSQHLKYLSFRGALDPSSPNGPSIGGVIRPGTPVALINAPAAGLHDITVVEGSSSSVVLAGPGHRRDTPLPGQPGESVIVGRSTTAGAPFRYVSRLVRGDLITVRTGQGEFRYTVVGRLRPGSHPAPIAADSSLLVLVTSSRSGGLAGLSAGGLLYVEARLQGTAATAPPGRPVSVPAEELPGHDSPKSWPVVAGWLLALLAGSALGWALWSRWGILRAWLVSAPILLWIMWEFADAAMRLVPNVY